jgi:hypothetical protein
MSELQNRSSDDSATTVQISPPDIVRRRVTAWGGVRAEVIEFIKRDQFEYKFHAHHHLLIMSERTSRDDGETLVDGLPISTARDFGRKLILVPAGHELQGWQKPGAPTRVTYFYIDPHSTLLGSEGRLADGTERTRDRHPAPERTPAQRENGRGRSVFAISIARYQTRVPRRLG